MWGCRPHWYKSPKTLRAKVWATYVPGQEVNKNPSAEYVEVGRTSRVWVPIIRSWALTRGFALHPGTGNRYEIRCTRTQHRTASRQVNDHGRVCGTHTPPACEVDNIFSEV